MVHWYNGAVDYSAVLRQILYPNQFQRRNNMKVLVVNCGSSSLKYQLIDSKSESVLASGLCERIGIDGVLNHTPPRRSR